MTTKQVQKSIELYLVHKNYAKVARIIGVAPITIRKHLGSDPRVMAIVESKKKRNQMCYVCSRTRDQVRIFSGICVNCYDLTTYPANRRNKRKWYLYE